MPTGGGTAAGRASKVTPGAARPRTLPTAARLLAALVLLAPAPARGQAATATLVVEARDSRGQPVAGAKAVLEGPVPRVGESGRDGRVFLPELPPGRYHLSIARDGVGSAEVWLEVGPSLRYEIAATLAEPGGVEARNRPATGRSADAGRRFGEEDLGDLPHAADPWSLLRDVPGVVLDRVDVGGSETAQQSLLVSRGDDGSGASFSLDGVDITDPAALGFTSLYPDMDSLAFLEARSSALDVRVRTPGVQVGLFVREPTDAFSGALYFRRGGFLQGDNLPTELQGRPFLRNRTRSVSELGGWAGRRLMAGRLWLLGAVHRSALSERTFTEHEDRLRTTSWTAKARLRLGGGTLSLLAVRAEKQDDDRDTGLSAAPEARWTQSGPVHLLALEDQRDLLGFSLLTHASWLDAGFRLEPHGGRDANVFQDFRGVFQGSYESFETERPRLQAGFELAGRRRALGLEHELLLGLDYRRSRVTTRASWPGNQVLGLENQTVFFRAFELTGFAILTRDQAARSVQEDAAAYLQDTLRLGRVTVTAGLRLERLAGRVLASSVPANPSFPELLPAVTAPGAPSPFRWNDVLPRAAVAWDVAGDGSLLAQVSYAAFGAALGSSTLTFDDPIGRQPASLTFYWRDLDGDHVVEPGELDLVNGLLGSSGLDPAAPASASSPHTIDTALRSPRTQELRGALEARLWRSATAKLEIGLRRLRHPLWAPLRGLTRGDYAATGAVHGSLFGEDYTVVYFAPASESLLVPGNGRILTNREGYHRDAVTASLSLTGGGEPLRFEAWGAYTDWREFFDDPERAIQDPTPLDVAPLQDAGPVAVRSGGLGRDDLFVGARWTAGLSLHARLVAGFTADARVHLQEGAPIPYLQVANTGDPTGGAKPVLVSPHLASYRLPGLAQVDLRLGRELRLPRGRLLIALDAFNLLDAATTLQVARDVELPAFDRPREIVRPRLFRLDLEYRF